MTLSFSLAHTPEWTNEQTVNTQKNSSSEAYSSVLVEKEYCGRKLVKEHFEELNFEMTFWCHQILKADIDTSIICALLFNTIG